MTINPTLSEWLNLIFRWVHVFAGIMWVGTTYYFTWLDADAPAAEFGPTEDVLERLAAGTTVRHGVELLDAVCLRRHEPGLFLGENAPRLPKSLDQGLSHS